MRKLYALLAGLCLVLTTIPAPAQQPTSDVAKFSSSVNSPDNNVVFTNASLTRSPPGPRRAFWSPGDGSGKWTQPLEGTPHHYAVAGTYTVCLKIYRYISNTNESVLSAQIIGTTRLAALRRGVFAGSDFSSSISECPVY